MNFNKAVKSIIEIRNPGPCEIAVRAHTRGEITRDSMETLAAMETARSLQDYPVRQYPAPSPAVALYAEQRRLNLRDADLDLAKKNGEWLFVVERLFQANKHDEDLLGWAKNICLKVGNHRGVRDIEERIQKFRGLEFPWPIYNAARATQQIDSDYFRGRGQGRSVMVRPI